jgi:hypothetical protein
MESEIIQFGTDFKYNHKKTPIENWKDAKEHFAKKGIDIGGFPVMTDAEKEDLAKQLENIK